MQQIEQGKMLPDRGGEHAHRRSILPDNAGGVVEDVVFQEGVSGGRFQLPVRDADASFDARGGNLVEIVLPAVVVGIVVLVVEFGFVQVRAEMQVDLQRTLARPAERIEVELRIRADIQVIGLLSGEGILTLGVPMDKVPQLALCTGIDIGGIPLRVFRFPDQVRLVEVIVEDPVSDTAVHLGDDIFVSPRLQPEEKPVLQFHHPDRIGRGVGMVIEDSVVEFLAELVGNLVVVGLPIDGILAAVTDEGGGYLLVPFQEGVARGREGIGPVPAGAQFLDKVEGNAVLLVQEEGMPLDVGGGFGQEDIDLTGVHRRIADPHVVPDTAVLLAGNHVVDIAAVGQVSLAQVVGVGGKGLVGGGFLLEDAVSAEEIVFQREVEGRPDVLRSEDVQVVGLGLHVGKEGTGVGQLGVRRLGVVHRQGFRGIGPAFVRLIEGDPGGVLPPEEIIGLYCGTGHAQPGGVHIFAQEGIVVVAVVGRGVDFLDVHLVEVPLMRPHDDAFVLHGIRQGEGLQDARRVFDDAVADGLQAVFQGQDAVCFLAFQGQALLQEVFLPFQFAHLGPACGKGGLGGGQGVGVIQGIQAGPVDGIARCLQRIAHLDVGERIFQGYIVFVAEGVDVFQGIGSVQGVAGRQAGQGVRRGQGILRLQGELLQDESLLEFILVDDGIFLDGWLQGGNGTGNIHAHRLSGGKQDREERNPQPLEEMLHLAKVIRILRFTKAGCLLIPVRAGCPGAPDDLHSPGSR